MTIPATAAPYPPPICGHRFTPAWTWELNRGAMLASTAASKLRRSGQPPSRAWSDHRRSVRPPPAAPPEARAAVFHRTRPGPAQSRPPAPPRSSAGVHQERSMPSEPRRSDTVPTAHSADATNHTPRAGPGPAGPSRLQPERAAESRRPRTDEPCPVAGPKDSPRRGRRECGQQRVGRGDGHRSGGRSAACWSSTPFPDVPRPRLQSGRAGSRPELAEPGQLPEPVTMTAWAAMPTRSAGH